MYVNNTLAEITIRNDEMNLIKLILNNKKKNSTISKIILDNLVVHSGSIVIGDPCYLDNSHNDFIEINNIPIGKYPIIAHIKEKKGDKRISIIEIVVNEDMATSKLTIGHFGVDSATGSVLDQSGLQTIDSVQIESIYENIVQSLDDNYVNTYTYGSYILPNKKTNIISFTTGNGDGQYEIIGHYNNEKICKVSIDFLV